MPYIQDKSRYAKPEDEVAIVKYWGEVAMCEFGGNLFPIHRDRLGDVPNVPEQQIKETKPRETKKPLTQAEKLQLEYLNSKR